MGGSQGEIPWPGREPQGMMKEELEEEKVDAHDDNSNVKEEEDVYDVMVLLMMEKKEIKRKMNQTRRKRSRKERLKTCFKTQFVLELEFLCDGKSVPGNSFWCTW